MLDVSPVGDATEETAVAMASPRRLVRNRRNISWYKQHSDFWSWYKYFTDNGNTEAVSTHRSLGGLTNHPPSELNIVCLENKRDIVFENDMVTWGNSAGISLHVLAYFLAFAFIFTNLVYT